MTPALFLAACSLAAPPAAAAPAPVPAPILVGPVAASPLGCAGCGAGGLGGTCATGICPGGADPDPMEKKGLFAKLKKRLKKPFGRSGRGKDAGDEAVSASAGFGGGCSTCFAPPVVVGLPPIPGSPPAAPPAKPAPAAPKGEGSSVRTVVPGVPAPMPGRAAF